MPDLLSLNYYNYEIFYYSLLIQNEDVNLKDFIDVEIAEFLIVLTSVLQYTIIINENILLEVI